TLAYLPAFRVTRGWHRGAATLPADSLRLPVTALPDRLQTALDAASSVDPTDCAGAHLADYAFRFGPEPAPVSTVARPSPGEAWTLAQTLQEVRLGRVALVETSRGVRPRHGRLIDRALARAVATHAGPLRVW